MKVSERFGNRLKAARIQKGLTQKELAEKCELALNTIRNLEQNNNEAPNGNTVVKLSNVLEVTTDYLLKGVL